MKINNSSKNQGISYLIRKYAIAIVFIIISIACIIAASIISNRTDISQELLSKVASVKLEAPTTLKTGSVTIKYVDTDGNEIADSDTITGTVGDEYKAERKSIATYAAYGAEPTNKAGNYEEDTQEVVFTYEKEDTSVEVSEEDNTVTIKTLHTRNSEEYDIKIVTKDENGNTAKGMTYDVSKDDGTVLRNGKVQGETFVAGTLTISDEGTETYVVTEDPGIYYAKLEENPIEFTINKYFDTESNKFAINVTYPDGYNGVKISVDEDTNAIIIEVTNQATEVDKVFDLKVEKYISKVVVKEDGNVTSEFTADASNKDDIIKVDIAKSKLGKVKLEVSYVITVENVGDVSGYATEITDKLPENLKYVSGGTWVVDGQTLTTDELKDIELASGDKKEISLVAEYDVNSDTIGLAENNAEITEYENEEEIEDKTPDNVDTAALLTTVKTGGAQIPVAIICGILCVVAIIVCAIKANSNKKDSKNEVKDDEKNEANENSNESEQTNEKNENGEEK